MRTFSFILCALLLYACSTPSPIETDLSHIPDTTFIQSAPQRIGDPVAGKEYMLSSKYISSGIPVALTEGGLALPGSGSPDMESIDQVAVVAPNGVKVLSPNCLQCHSQKLNGKTILGLGNSMADFTFDQSQIIETLDVVIKSQFGENSPEYEAYDPFARALYTMGPRLRTKVVGANPADKMAAILAAHRDPVTLEWSTKENLDVPSGVIPSDVPPWWLLKKKNAMFYTAVGRGDFARLMMASSLLTMKDTIEAAVIDRRFADVVAFIHTLEPPAYPEAIDHGLATKGQLLFEKSCSTCHGTYGENETYPNLLVDLKTVKTDSFLTLANFANPEFVNWYNDSWFAKGEHAAKLQPETGYIAPPLDGIWASAPYLHNGSVPDIASVLNSKDRPQKWQRTFDSNDYNYERLGWNYKTMDEKSDKFTYDTTIKGYGNYGHPFGDRLSPEERGAVLEYLKTI